MGSFVRTVALGFGLVGATVVSQVPEFAQQYTQRLGGAVDELRDFVREFDEDARAAGLERRQAAERMVRNADAFIRNRGEDAVGRIGRLERLDPHYRTLSESHGLSRLSTFLTGADQGIVRRTFDDFRMALPLTSEGAIAAAAGFLLGLVLVFAWSATWKRTVGRRKAKKLAAAYPFVPAADTPPPAGGAAPKGPP